MTRPSGMGRQFMVTAIVFLALSGCSQPPSFADIAAPSVLPSSRNGLFGNGLNQEVAHDFTLRAANAEIEAQQLKHIAECEKLGGKIRSTSINHSDRGLTSANTVLRIKPESYNAFAASLAAQPAKISFHSQTARDSSAPMLDTKKRLAAKTYSRGIDGHRQNRRELDVLVDHVPCSDSTLASGYRHRLVGYSQRAASPITARRVFL